MLTSLIAMLHKHAVISHKPYKIETKLVQNSNIDDLEWPGLVAGLLISHHTERRAVCLRQLSVLW